MKLKVANFYPINGTKKGALERKGLKNLKRSREFYQSLELAIYFLPAFLVGFLVGLYSFWLGIVVGILFFIYPKFKKWVAIKIARKRGIKDYRQVFKFSNFFFDGFLFWGSQPLQIIGKYGALSRSLDVIYNYSGKFGVSPKEVKKEWWRRSSPYFFTNRIIKKWTDVWMGMPIGQDVRARLGMVAEEIERQVLSIYEKNPNKAIKIVLLAGGTKQDVIMALNSLFKKIPTLKIKVVCIEPDGKFALRRAQELEKHFKIPKGILIDIFKKTSTNPSKKQTLKEILKNKGYDFYDFDLVVCIGRGDYAFGDKIYKFVKMLDNGKVIITANISDNFIERKYLHDFIRWPKMQYLDPEDYKNILHSVLGKDRKIEIRKTPNEIFNLAIIQD